MGEAPLGDALDPVKAKPGGPLNALSRARVAAWSQKHSPRNGRSEASASTANVVPNPRARSLDLGRDKVQCDVDHFLEPLESVRSTASGSCSGGLASASGSATTSSEVFPPCQWFSESPLDDLDSVRSKVMNVFQSPRNILQSQSPRGFSDVASVLRAHQSTPCLHPGSSPTEVPVNARTVSAPQLLRPQSPSEGVIASPQWSESSSYGSLPVMHQKFLGLRSPSPSRSALTGLQPMPEEQESPSLMANRVGSNCDVALSPMHDFRKDGWCQCSFEDDKSMESERSAIASDAAALQRVARELQSKQQDLNAQEHALKKRQEEFEARVASWQADQGFDNQQKAFEARVSRWEQVLAEKKRSAEIVAEQQREFSARLATRETALEAQAGDLKELREQLIKEAETLRRWGEELCRREAGCSGNRNDTGGLQGSQCPHQGNPPVQVQCASADNPLAMESQMRRATEEDFSNHSLLTTTGEVPTFRDLGKYAQAIQGSSEKSELAERSQPNDEYNHKTECSSTGNCKRECAVISNTDFYSVPNNAGVFGRQRSNSLVAKQNLSKHENLPNGNTKVSKQQQIDELLSNLFGGTEKSRNVVLPPEDVGLRSYENANFEDQVLPQDGNDDKACQDDDNAGWGCSLAGPDHLVNLVDPLPLESSSTSLAGPDHLVNLLDPTTTSPEPFENSNDCNAVPDQVKYAGLATPLEGSLGSWAGQLSLAGTLTSSAGEVVSPSSQRTLRPSDAESEGTPIDPTMIVSPCDGAYGMYGGSGDSLLSLSPDETPATSPPYTPSPYVDIHHHVDTASPCTEGSGSCSQTPNVLLKSSTSLVWNHDPLQTPLRLDMEAPLKLSSPLESEPDPSPAPVLDDIDGMLMRQDSSPIEDSSSDPGNSPVLCAVKAYLARDTSLANISTVTKYSSADPHPALPRNSGSPSSSSSLASSPLTRPSLGCVSLRLAESNPISPDEGTGGSTSHGEPPSSYDEALSTERKADSRWSWDVAGLDVGGSDLSGLEGSLIKQPPPSFSEHESSSSNSGAIVANVASSISSSHPVSVSPSPIEHQR